MCLNIDFDFCSGQLHESTFANENGLFGIILKESDDIRTKDCLLHIAFVAQPLVWTCLELGLGP
jgi:hypothetical protein